MKLEIEEKSLYFNKKEKLMKKKIVFAVLLIALILLAVFLIIHFRKAENAWNRTEFVQAVQSGKVDAVKIIVEKNNYRVEGVTRNGLVFHSITAKDPSLLQIMNDAGVDFQVEPEPSPPWWAALAGLVVLLPILISLVQLVVMVLIMVYIKKIHDALKNKDI